MGDEDIPIDPALLGDTGPGPGSVASDDADNGAYSSGLSSGSEDEYIASDQDRDDRDDRASGSHFKASQDAQIQQEEQEEEPDQVFR